MKRLGYLLLPILTVLCTICSAQEENRIRIGFYNVENLYDTIRDPSIDDENFTPAGKHRWNTERYRTKIGNLARVIDSMSCDIIGLAEVENEGVVRDLIEALDIDYNYVHRETDDRRGMDVVLLYRGSQFVPRLIRQKRNDHMSRQLLLVTGELHGETVSFIVCHMPSLFNSTEQRLSAMCVMYELLDEILTQDPNHKLVILGDFNTTPGSELIGMLDQFSLSNPFRMLENAGFGSYVYRVKPYLYDFMLLSPGLLTGKGLYFNGQCGIFSPDFLFRQTSRGNRYPLRSFESGTYRAGYSDHLPVYLHLAY